MKDPCYIILSLEFIENVHSSNLSNLHATYPEKDLNKYIFLDICSLLWENPINDLFRYSSMKHTLNSKHLKVLKSQALYMF